jgi:hypothetical protein
MNVCDQYPDRRLDEGELLADVIVEEALSLLPPEGPERSWSGSPIQLTRAAALRSALERDGLTFSDGDLRRILPSEVQMPEAKNEVDRLLSKYEMVTANGHLDQARDAHGRGDWGAANGQLRTFFDALLDSLAEKLDPTARDLRSGQPRRERLAKLGFLSADLNEWSSDGKNFINGLMRRLHPQGSHPGLSGDGDSTFRLQIVLVTARLLLTRFDTWDRR